MRTCLSVALVLALTPVGHAHPVPRQYYDRTISVHVSRDRVIVDYQLDVDVYTVYEDLGEFSKEVDLSNLTKSEQFCEAFNRCYASILAGNLDAWMDGKELTFRCAKTGHATKDENGLDLLHLRCQLRFEAPWTGGPTERHEFRFREGNYELQTGRVRLSLIADSPIVLVGKTEPSEALKARPDTELRPGDVEKLRSASATFVLRGPARAVEPAPVEQEPPARSPSGPGLAIAAAIAVCALAGLLFLGRQLRRLVRA
jgi:hypothetical protein